MTNNSNLVVCFDDSVIMASDSVNFDPQLFGGRLMMVSRINIQARADKIIRDARNAKRKQAEIEANAKQINTPVNTFAW
jgi:hypothetical protein